MSLYAVKTLLAISSLISTLFCFFSINAASSGYQGVFVLPLAFLLILPLLTGKLKVKGDVSISLWFVTMFSWMRYVVMPLLGVVSGYYSDYGILGSAESTSTAIILMTAEIILVSGLAYLIVAKKKNKKKPLINVSSLHLSGSRYAYLAFVMMAAFVFFTVGRQLNLFQFIFIDANTMQMFSDTTEYSSVTVRAFIITGMSFLMLLSIAKVHRQYLRSAETKYVYYALIIVMLRLFVIVGQRRSAQIYLGFSTTLLMLKLFPASKKSIVATIGLSAGTVLISMSIYKFFNAYLYGSYAAAMANAEISWAWFASTLDSYFFGLKVVASNIQYADDLFSRSDLLTMFQEIGRNIFGLHYFFKSNTMTAAQQYNLFIYRGAQANGHLLSSLGYGYLYGGVLLSSIFTMFNVGIMFWVERLIKKTNAIEYYYVLAVVFIRFAFSLYSNPMPLINYSSQELIITGIVVAMARLVKRRKAISMHYARELI